MCGCSSVANGRMGGVNGMMGGALEKEDCANIGETQQEGDEDLERATAQVAPSLTSSRHHLNGVKQLVSLSMDNYNSSIMILNDTGELVEKVPSALACG